MLDFAEANGMEFRFHTLAWYNYVPSWLNQLDTVGREAALRNHVETVMKRYCGRVSSWDVVNEALNGDGSFRTGHVWANFDYIDVAFRTGS